MAYGILAGQRSGVQSVNNVLPDVYGNVDLIPENIGAVKSVDGVKVGPDGNVKLGAVKSVDGVKPKPDGSVTIEGKFPKGNPAITHNLPRGVFLGNSVTTKQYASIEDGSFEDIYVGDYWTIGGRDYIVAGVNYYKNCGDTSTSKNHLVIIPRSNLYTAKMNPSNTTDGGYANSEMRTKNLEQAKAIIKEAFPGHVLTKRLYLVNAVSSGQASGGSWYDSDVDLMNENMVYGCPILGAMTHNGSVPSNYRIEKSQLPIFTHSPELINIRSNYWLQDVVSASRFAAVSADGLANVINASDAYGVRPAFIIG